MRHLTEQEIADWPRGEASASPAALAHLESCSACRTKREQQIELWNLLGEWQAPLLPKRSRSILAQVESEKRRSRLNWPLFRVAAAVVIAAGVGLFVGRTTATREAVPPEKVVTDLHLNYLEDTFSGALEDALSGKPPEEVPG
jgi:predicted anti-sigma-YlaC factor YlaD